MRSKDAAISAGVLGMLVWYGFFIVIGEGYFHMWQTEIGLGSVEGAFRYGTVCAVLMFYIARPRYSRRVLDDAAGARVTYFSGPSALNSRLLIEWLFS